MTESTSRKVVQTSVYNDFFLKSVSKETTLISNGQSKKIVGVWSICEDGALKRISHKSSEWPFWADVEGVPPKSNQRAIVLGESVARGYLIEPALSLASAIEKAFTFSNEEKIQVVDLARTDASIGDLREIVLELPHLSPDYIVLFAGNNWYKCDLSFEEFNQCATIYKQKGLFDLGKFFKEDIILPRVRKFLKEFSASALGIPVILVVPEFNLGDWNLEPVLRSQGLEPRLKGDQSETLLQSIVKKFDLGCEAHEKRDNTNARSLLEETRDLLVGLFLPHSPRSSRAITDELALQGKQAGWTVIDLREELQGSNGRLPDRTVFLDYCHLNASTLSALGNKVADLLLSTKTLEHLKVVDYPSCFVSSAERAESHILAAIHNSHFGQPLELLEWHVKEATRLDPNAGRLIGIISEILSQKIPLWLSPRILEIQNYRIFRNYLLKGDTGLKSLFEDSRLVEIFSRYSESPPPMKDACDERKFDITDQRYFARTFREARGYHLAREYPFVISFGEKFEGSFYLKNQSKLLIEMVIRLPPERWHITSAFCELQCNGKSIYEFELSSDWQYFSTIIERTNTNEGINRFDILWPVLPKNSDRESLVIADSLLVACTPPTLAHRGEVWKFTVTTENNPE